MLASALVVIVLGGECWCPIIPKHDGHAFTSYRYTQMHALFPTSTQKCKMMLPLQGKGLCFWLVKPADVWLQKNDKWKVLYQVWSCPRINAGSPCTTSQRVFPVLYGFLVTVQVHALTRALAHTFKPWYRPLWSHFPWKKYGGQLARGLFIVSLSQVHSSSFYLSLGNGDHQKFFFSSNLVEHKCVISRFKKKQMHICLM